MASEQIVVHWFRRDLRSNDNHALYEALKSGFKVLPVFIFDTEILDKLEDKNDSRVNFIYNQVELLNAQFQKGGSSVKVFYGKPLDAFRKLIDTSNINSVYTNHDYEPYAIARDKAVKELLKTKNIEFLTFKDQLIFEKNEICKDNGTPYTIFTPFSKKWLAVFNDLKIPVFGSGKLLSALLNFKEDMPSLKSIGFNKSSIPVPSADIDDDLIHEYDKQRDYPSVKGTSRLGIHLRFGTISIRQLVKIAAKENDTYLKELIWREFYMMILWHFPHVVNSAFKPQYNRIRWRNNEAEFDKWKAGMTGYPIVDAGMRELAATGFMHNRVRMITASFLSKHLLIDWRWGEAWFAQKLLDYELASNNGGWQWAAGTGCDAAPYFRIFNPYEQTKKFDPQLNYIRKWIPELETPDYPQPIVDHKEARERCLRVYKEALNQNN